MEWIVDELIDLIRRIELSQKEHLTKNCTTEMLDAIVEHGEYDNGFIGVTRAIKNTLRVAAIDIRDTIAAYQNEQN